MILHNKKTLDKKGVYFEYSTMDATTIDIYITFIVSVFLFC